MFSLLKQYYINETDYRETRTLSFFILISFNSRLISVPVKSPKLPPRNYSYFSLVLIVYKFQYLIYF